MLQNGYILKEFLKLNGQNMEKYFYKVFKIGFSPLFYTIEKVS